MNNIRNFCIIAHIDHGKSTLADCILEITGTITKKEKKNQLLDDMDIERERGITIKSHAIQIEYKYKGELYIFNLIDTPGHVDFSYEVSRSIAACEGALLVVDASQSIQAQTISNLYIALKNNLTIIPILNKIDLPNANIEEVSDDIINLIGCQKEEIIYVSAKKRIGIKKILEKIILSIPPPQGDPNTSLQAIIFDSVYNPFRGVEIYFRVQNGKIFKGQMLRFIATGKTCFSYEIGTLKLEKKPKNIINTGDVGYLISGIKNACEVKVGDTLTTIENLNLTPIIKFEEVKPMVFSGIYPIDNKDYEQLCFSLEKLRLNDASLVFTHESSVALGFGFRCGFLGMLHMEIIQERLEREYNITVITTMPNVSYRIYLNKNPNEYIIINNPSDFPNFTLLEKIEEPYIKATIITIVNYIGLIISLCIEKRGIIKNQFYLTPQRVELIFELPLSEVIFDFYDRLKTISKGYASFDYSILEYRKSDLVKLNILINFQNVDALSMLIHRSNVFNIGKKICEKLSKLIPQKQFEIPIQAVIGNKVIARETIRSLRKDVTAKCYGGDISRKRKLLEKQKKGKKKMRQIGHVEIPQSAFIAILKLKNS